jgi:hypothetical protein
MIWRTLDLPGDQMSWDAIRVIDEVHCGRDGMRVVGGGGPQNGTDRIVANSGNAAVQRRHDRIDVRRGAFHRLWGEKRASAA